MPNPNNYKNQNDFMKVCIPVVLKEGTAKDNEQAKAICISMWEDKGKKKMQSFKQQIILQAFKTPVLSESEILSLIDNDTLNKIKQKDEHPYFQAFSICHEGISKPKLLGQENNKKPVKWTRKAVQSLKDLVLKGIKFFKGHNKDNSVDNREDFGEIIANKELEIDNKLHHIVIGYFPDKEKIKDDDVVSQEGLWNFLESSGEIIADKVEEITGIALGNSDFVDPAFEDARRLGMIQCFADGMSVPDGTSGNKTKEVIMEITKKDVIEFIQKNNLHIHELGFTLDDAKKDRVIGKALEDYEKKITEFEEKEKALLEEKKQTEERIKEYVDKENLNLAKTRFEGLIKELKDDEKIFIEKKFDLDKPEDLSEAGLKKFIESKQNEFKIIEPLFNKGDTKIFTPSKENPTDKEDLTKAENNELLEEDFNPYQ